MTEASTTLYEQSKAAQDRFDEMYITSTEIGTLVNVSRPTVMRARIRGLLPGAISVGDNVTYIWERKTLKPYLDAWSHSLAARRGQLA